MYSKEEDHRVKCFCIVFLASILVFANTFASASLQNTRIMETVATIQSISETVARLRKMLLDGQPSLAAKARQKPNFNG